MTSRPVGALAAVILCLAALPAVAAGLVIKRVMLSAGGVAYVEREAEVDGNAELALDHPWTGSTTCSNPWSSMTAPAGSAARICRGASQ